LPTDTIGPTINISDCIAIGDFAIAGAGVNHNSDCIAIGDSALAGGAPAQSANTFSDCIAIGDASTAGDKNFNQVGLIAIGNGSLAQGAYSCVAIAGNGGFAGASATDHDCIVIGDTIAYGAGSIAIGDVNTHSGSSNSTQAANLAIGFSAQACNPSNSLGTQIGNIAIGQTAHVGFLSLTDSYNIGIGQIVTAQGGSSVGIGHNVVVNAASSVSIGPSSFVDDDSSTAVGDSTVVHSFSGTAIGVGANLASTCSHSLAVGSNAYLNSSSSSIAIGYGAGDGLTGVTGAYDNIAIGDNSSAQGLHDCIVIGDSGQAGNESGGSSTDHDDLSIGNSNIIYGVRNVGIGFATSISQGTAHDTVLLGSGATADWGGSNSQSNAFICGSFTYPTTDVWFGSGMNTGGSAPTTWNLRGSENWGSTSNKTGGRLNIVAGRGFDGGAGGDLHLQTSNVAGAGVIGAAQDVGIFDHFGNAVLGLNNTTNASTFGFAWIPAGTSGPPTGTPLPLYAGAVPMWYDTTNDFLYIYNGGWKKTTVFA
jgi:hypothetical protein